MSNKFLRAHYLWIISLLCLWPMLGSAEVFTSQKVPAHSYFQWTDRWETPDRPKITLALSGGGPRGFVHLGFVKAMEEDGIEFDSIAGTSIGAIIGGFLAAGYTPKEIERIFLSEQWDDLLFNLDRRRPSRSQREHHLLETGLHVAIKREGSTRVGALVSTDQLERILYRKLLPAQVGSQGVFDQLRYPLRVVATDLLSGERVVASEGDLIAAIRGSFAIPGIFAPVEFEEALLVDGSLVENLPTETGQNLNADLLLGVDVSEGVPPMESISGSLNIFNRSISIIAEDRNEALRSLADLALVPDTGEAPVASFDAALPLLVPVGQQLYKDHRDQIRLLLAERSTEPLVKLTDIRVEGTDWISARTLEHWIRSGSYPLTETTPSVPRLFLRMALTKALNLGPFRKGELELVKQPNGKHRATFRFTEHPPVQEVAVLGADDLELYSKIIKAALDDWIGTPYQPYKVREWLGLWREAKESTSGHIWERLQLNWRPDTGTLTVEPRLLMAGEFNAVDLESSVPHVQRSLVRLQHRPLNIDQLANTLDDRIDRGAIHDWRLNPSSSREEHTDFKVEVKRDRLIDLYAGLEFRSDFDLSAWTRAALTNLTNRGDFADLTVSWQEERLLVETRYRSEFGAGRYDLGFEVGASYHQSEVPIVDASQEVLAVERPRTSAETLWAAAVHRPKFGGLFRLGMSQEWSRQRDPSGSPPRELERGFVFIEYERNQQDRHFLPTSGTDLWLRYRTVATGDDLRQTEGRFQTTFSYRKFRFSGIGSFGLSQDGVALQETFDPGGYRDRYGWIPHGARAFNFAGTGLRVRRELLDVDVARVYVELGGDLLSTGDQSSNLSLNQAEYGYGVAITAVSKFIGPMSLGAFRNEAGADGIFFTLGISDGIR